MFVVQTAGFAIAIRTKRPWPLAALVDRGPGEILLHYMESGTDDDQGDAAAPGPEVDEPVARGMCA